MTNQTKITIIILCLASNTFGGGYAVSKDCPPLFFKDGDSPPMTKCETLTDYLEVCCIKTIKLMFDNNTLSKYEEYYFSLHKRATKKPIAKPYHESINKWMIMKRPMMNALKRKWKDFIVWFIESQGYSNLRIDKCEIVFNTVYETHRRHDNDNSCPKFIIDGLVESGFLIDDDSKHLILLSLKSSVDEIHPRTEIYVKIKE